MKKLQTVLLCLLAAILLAGSALADVIPLPREEMTKAHPNPLIIALIVIVIVVAALIIVKAALSAKRNRKDRDRDNKSDPQG